MKKQLYLLFLVLFIIPLSLSGCGIEDHIYANTYIGFWGQESNATLLKNINDHQQYLANVTSNSDNHNFLSALSSYDASFFDENMLVVIYDHAPSADYKVSVKSIVYHDSEIRVVLEYKVPKWFTEIMGNTAIIIELPQNNQYTHVTVQAQESY